jgi:protein SCO1/2
VSDLNLHATIYGECDFCPPEKDKINTKKWSLVTGSKESIYDVALNGYFLNAMEDDQAPGGFLHSEMLVLVDKDKHIRGLYEGTNTEDVDRLMEEIKLLKKEEDRKEKALRDARE